MQVRHLAIKSAVIFFTQTSISDARAVFLAVVRVFMSEYKGEDFAKSISILTNQTKVSVAINKEGIIMI